MCYVAIRRRKLSATSGTQPSFLVRYSKSSGNRSERCSRTIHRQIRKTFWKSRYVMVIGLLEKDPGGSEIKDIY